MNCEEFSEALSAYLDGELSAEERSTLEAHLERCPRCREELKSLRAVSRLVGTLPQVKASPAFLSALSQGVAIRKRSRWLRPIPLFKGDLVPALAAAAVLLIAVTVVLVLPSVGRFRRAVAPYEAPLTLSKPETAAPSAAPRAEGVTVEERAERAPAPAPTVPPTERGLMDLAREKTGPPATAAAPYKGEGQQQAILAGHKDGGGAPAREEAAGTSEAPAKAEESAASRVLPMSNALAGPDARGEALSGAEAPASPTTGKAGEATAKEAAPEVAQKEALPYPKEAKGGVGGAATGPGFVTVTLRCTDDQAGQRAFDAALTEFAALESPIPDPATTRPMTQEEDKRYSQVVRELLTSPDVVTFEEMRVPAADLDLVQAVFTDRVGVSFADTSADTVKFRGVLSARRAQAGAGRVSSQARAPEAAPSTSRARGLAVSTKAGPRGGELVRVIVALRRQPATPPPSRNQ
jgi:hypothetical protein